MRRRSARLSSAGFSGSDSRDSVEFFNTRYSLTSFFKKARRLTDEQKKAIEETGFGNLLLIPNQSLNKNLLLELMRRWDSMKQSFVLPCGDIGLTLKDVALTFGLRVVGVPVELDDDEPFLDLESRYGAVVWKRNVSVASIENKLDSLGEICNENFVQTFLLYTFGTFLFPNADGKVDTRYLSFLKSVDRIRSCAWGQAVLVHLIKWLDIRKETDAICVGGCLLFLQIWSFEHIDIARPALLDICAAFPRVCHWDKTKTSNRQQLVSKFKDLQDHEVTWELQPTSQELEVDIIGELLVAESNEKELPATRNSNFAIVDDIDLETSHQCGNQEVIEVEIGSETSCTSERQNKREENLDNPAHDTVTDTIDSCCSTPCILSKLQKQPNQVAALKDPSATTPNYDEDLRTRVQILEAQNLLLNEEINQLKRENYLLRATESKLEEKNAKLIGENDDLRRKNQFLSLSSNDFVDRLEKILLDEDAIVSHASQPTKESCKESAEPVGAYVCQIQSNSR